MIEKKGLFSSMKITVKIEKARAQTSKKEKAEKQIQ